MRIDKKGIARFLSAAGMLIAVGSALALDITIPPETTTFQPSNLPGYQLAQRNCMTCHSAQYVSTQPPSPRKYWEATVRKMQKPFGAQFPDEDIPALVDYLSKTYGTERSPLAPAPHAMPARPAS